MPTGEPDCGNGGVFKNYKKKLKVLSHCPPRAPAGLACARISSVAPQAESVGHLLLQSFLLHGPLE